jgi:predicted transposase YbfD/YdcC
MENILGEWFDYEDFSVHFEDLLDHRQGNKIQYDIKEVILLSLSAIICGAESWVDIESFGKGKLRVLRAILPYKQGIPSHYTIQRVLCSLDHKHFAECLEEWFSEIRDKALANDMPIAKAVSTELPKRHEEHGVTSHAYNQICVDGKTLRGASSRREDSLHLLSAWCNRLGMFICQEEVADKSNEITAIPHIINKLSLSEDTLVSLDAMGCQKSIAEGIINNGGQYLLAVKRNHKGLYDQISRFFDYYEKRDFKDAKRILSRYDYPIELNGGRIEERRAVLVNSVSWIDGEEKWSNAASVIAIYSTTTNKRSHKVSREVRYYISSVKSTAKDMGTYVRKHWGIENCLHWMLDAVFKEDDIKIYQRNAASNIAILRRLALSLLKSAKKPKQSIKSLKMAAAFDNKVLRRVLML